MSKITIKQDKLPEFMPIELNIVIESAEEFAYLWGLFNTPEGTVINNVPAKYSKLYKLVNSEYMGRFSQYLFTAINDKAIELDLRPNYY